MSTQPTLDFVLINVADIEASFQYFIETLGFTTDPEQNAPTFRYLKGAPGGIDSTIRQAGEANPVGKIELYFKTHGLEGLRAELIDRRAEASPISPIMHPPFGTIFTVQSPDGMTLTMMGA